MRTITADQSWEGRKLIRFLAKALPSCGAGQLHRLLRLGRVRVDGKRAGEDTVLSSGQTVEIYAEDVLFEEKKKEDPFFSKLRPKLTVLYEDENVILLDKQAGLICQPDESEKVNTLLTWVQAYLYQKGEWDPGKDFAPALCNRIDRFTCGIVIVAKTEETLHRINDAIRTRQIEKYYLCIACGHMKYPDGKLRHFLYKAPESKKVRVLRREEPGSKEAVTWYQVCEEENGLSLVECLLGTGRTHQIRAQFAEIGHPLLGDSQYGDAKLNAKYHRANGQALCAYRLVFHFEGDAGCLAPLDGRGFQVRNVPFVKEYFPDVVIPEFE